MKTEILEKLSIFKKRIGALRKEIISLKVDTVGRKRQREEAEAIATLWVEELRSPLEHKFGLPKEIIHKTSESMKRLHVLSRPNNLKSSYLKVLNGVLRKFDDRFILHIQQSAFQVDSVLDLCKLVQGLEPDTSDYLHEAVDCASAGYRRAAVVLGWCAAVDRIQKKVLSVGLSKFNAASVTLKNQTRGRFKRWNKAFSVNNLSELQEIFDTDLIVILEGMNLIDSNQGDRLGTCFQYRNHSAHPSKAPIGDAHLIAFFTDVSEILLANADFDP